MKLKLFAQELLNIKHMKKLGEEVCTEYTHTAVYERFLEVNRPLSEDMQVKCCPSSHKAVHHDMMPLPALGSRYVLAGSKAGEP